MQTDIRRPLIILWLLGIAAGVAITPYMREIGLVPSGLSDAKVAIKIALQSALIYGLVAFLSYHLIQRTDLKPFGQIKPISALLAGSFVAAILWLSGRLFFADSPLNQLFSTKLSALLACFYGAINEEMLCRLLLLSALYLLFSKLLNKRSVTLWIATIISSLLFGVGHLPAARMLAPLTTPEVARILLLNGVAGTVFGYLYFSRGIYTSMLAHFITNVLLKVVLN